MSETLQSVVYQPDRNEQSLDSRKPVRHTAINGVQHGGASDPVTLAVISAVRNLAEALSMLHRSSIPAIPENGILHSTITVAPSLETDTPPVELTEAEAIDLIHTYCVPGADLLTYVNSVDGQPAAFRPGPSAAQPCAMPSVPEARVSWRFSKLWARWQRLIASRFGRFRTRS